MGTKRSGSAGTGMLKGRLIKVGRISKLFGTGGGLAISLYDVFPDKMNAEEPLWVVIDSLAVPLFADRFENRGCNGALVHFADIDTPQRAEEFIGHELYIATQEDKPDSEELYFEDLEDYTAIIREDGATAQSTGIISSYLDNELNPLFTVETLSGEEILIPASDDFIDEIDTDSRIVTFLLPAGLLGLNN